MSQKEIIIFTDGACSNNGMKNAKGGYGIHFPNKEFPDVSEIYYEKEACTNQKVELLAILSAIRLVKTKYPLRQVKLKIYTDSKYSIDCITKWVENWIKNGWLKVNKDPVLNRQYIEPIYRYYKSYDIEFEHVSAHTGKSDWKSVANSVADNLATQAWNNKKDYEDSFSEEDLILEPTNKKPIRKSSSTSKSRINTKSSVKTRSMRNKERELIIELIDTK